MDLMIELGSVISFEKGKKPIELATEPQKGYLPYVDIEAFETGTIKRYTSGEKCLACEDGDILIVCDGSRSGLVGYAIHGFVGSTLAKISCEVLLDQYLFYFLQGKYRLLNTNKKGTGTPHLNPTLLRQQKIVVPPIEEQQRIVTRIEELFSELDSAVETLQKAKQQLEVYRQAVLKEAFDGFVEKTTVREITSIVTSGSRGWAKYYSDNGAMFIRIGNLTHSGIGIDFSDIQHLCLPENAEGRRSRLVQGDILVSITADLGSIGLIPDNIGEAYINQHIALVRFNNKKQSRFMAWYFRSDCGQKELLKNKRGAGKLGLGLDDIRDSLVPIVSDEVAELTVANIESRLSVCDGIEKTINEALQQAEAMRQSILKKAFEGRL